MLTSSFTGNDHAPEATVMLMFNKVMLLIKSNTGSPPSKRKGKIEEILTGHFAVRAVSISFGLVGNNERTR